MDSRTRAQPNLSVIAPVFDESENLRPLYERVRAALEVLPSWELVLVDDGSRDDSLHVMRALAREDERVRVVRLAHNCGQTSALAAGIAAARADLVATLDADLQNDPAELPRLLLALDGHDAVVGYRVRRHDDWLRRVSSRIANGVRNRVTGDHVRDTGCSLKLFRAKALRSIALFEGLHRFLPTLLRWHGYDVIEVPVSHHPRTRGKSKYGVWNRLGKATRDLLAVRWMRARIIRLPLVEEPAPRPEPPARVEPVARRAEAGLRAR
jgi:glycosyltransferase involved in cell wall biosynthesis